MKKRKDISQDQEAGSCLINFKKHTLQETDSNSKLSDSYKLMMDELLEKHDSNGLNYINEETFREKTSVK